MKRVLITGGNKGIGLTTTKEFLDNNFEVFVVARKASEIELADDHLHLIDYDLSDHKQLPELVKQIGEIDVLINNAGIMHSVPPEDYTDEQMNEILAVNLISPAKLVTEFSKSMITNEEGRIVNVASIAGHIGHPDIWYGATKAGIISLTKSFAKLLGPKGVVINAVAPGPVDTDMMKKIPKQRLEVLKNNSLLGRVADPEEVASTIFWLATESPEYINGVTIDINNGAYIR